MILFITEDGSLYQGNEIADEDHLSINDGLMDAIRFEGGKFEQMVNGEWAPIEFLQPDPEEA
jgi:hypothetical protein